MRLASLMLPVVLSLPVPALALTLRICQDVRSHPPLMTADGKGVFDTLLRTAAAELGLEVEASAVPITRCKEGIRFNQYDIYPAAPYMEQARDIGRYPMAGAQPDPARALALMRLVGVRRVGDNISWDGKRIRGLQGKALAAGGTMVTSVFAAEQKMALDQSAFSLTQNLDKLLAGRGGLVIAWEQDARLALSQGAYAGRIELFDKPLREVRMYAPVSNGFYQAHPDLAEKLWSTLARLAHQPPLRDAIAGASGARGE